MSTSFQSNPRTVKSKSKFNAHQLRVGDFALVRREDRRAPEAGEVVFKAKRYLGSIRVRFSNGDERAFDSRNTGFADILAGARPVNGQWIPL
jgi:hypothetical protein